ncbi:MAG: mechanosensitive ion channel [Bacteroidetes bacterium]|nr:mechanosensitive ion channel [Bacteroidota bacterium]
MKEFLQQIWWNNTAQMYAIVLGEIILAWIFFRLFRKIIFSFLKKLATRTASDIDDAIVAGSEKFVIPFLYILVNYAIIQQLALTEHAERVLKVAVAVIVTYFIVRFINYVMHLAITLYMRRKNEPDARIRNLNGVLLVVKVMVWVTGILMLVDNLGYDITTIITGLGIGGIAIALAAQNILTDLFSYFVIFFDKPFEIGDSIAVNSIAGTVEHIGIKTSHIRSVTGEQLIMPNTELVKSTIKNYKRLERRGVTFKINVQYDTPVEKLNEIPRLLQQIVQGNSQATLDRCHLIGFGDYGLTFETLYFIDSADYKTYMNIQQKILLDIMQLFKEKNIGFAFPGQGLVLQNIVQSSTSSSTK